MIEDDDDFVEPKTPLDYISCDQLQDMWGAGFTVIRRNTFGNDVYELADRVKRPGMARQWVDKAEIDKFVADGWARVGSEEYPGLFAPFGYVGTVEIGLLGLIECPQHRVDKARQGQIAAAEKLVTDWQGKYGGDGFSGSVTVGHQTKLGELDSIKTTKIGSTKTIEDTTKIPRDMVPYVDRIFQERDAIEAQAVMLMESGTPNELGMRFQEVLFENPHAEKWPTMHALALPIAIENVRNRNMETDHK